MWWLHHWLQTEINARLPSFNVKMCDGRSLFSAVMKTEAEARQTRNKEEEKQEQKVL